MITRRQIGLGLVGAAAAALLAADWALLAVAHGSVPSGAFGLGSALGDGLAALGYAAGLAVGAIIVARCPGNRIGGLLVAAGLATLFGEFASEYARHALDIRPGSLPAGELVGWLGAWMWRVGVALIAGGVLLLFPDGRLPSPAWRPVAAVVGLLLGVYVLSNALAPGPMAGEFTIIDNPVAIGLPGLRAAMERRAMFVLAAVLVSVAGLVDRARSGPSVQRQQIKWLVYAGLLALAGLPMWDGQLAGWSIEGWWADLARLWTLLAVPAAIGIALLRHQLYNIDLVIRRTATYAVLTALLAGVYAGVVVILQRPLAPFTGGSEVVVAASTLAVAAAFGPLRRRVQGLVDRQFNRERYDAMRTVEAFGQRLRNQLDLAATSAELHEVVVTTMQPASLSLWLSDGTGTPAGPAAEPAVEAGRTPTASG